MKFAKISVLIVMMGIILTACQGQEKQVDRQPEVIEEEQNLVIEEQPEAVDEAVEDASKRIGIVVPTGHSDFYEAVIEGLSEEGEHLDLMLEWYGPSDTLEEQISSLEDAMQQGVDAMILWPVMETGYETVVEQAQDKGIHIYTIIQKQSAKVMSHLDIHYFAAGQQLGRFMVNQHLDEGGRIGIVGNDNDSVQALRLEGLMSSFEELEAIEVVWFSEELRSLDEVDSIILLDAEQSEMYLDAILEAKMPFATFEGKKLQPELFESEVLWINDVMQNPKEVGALSVHYAYDIFIGEVVPAEKLIWPLLQK